MWRIGWLGVLMTIGLASSVVLAQEQAQWPGDVVEFLALKSGFGVRWEPSELESKQFESGLERPLNEFYFNIAPYAQNNSSEVHTETLAWTILAELAWAGELKRSGSPRALVFAYLIAKQIQFATSQLKDEQTLLYKNRWQETDAVPISFAPKDQVLMLWALSEYSATIDELINDGAQSNEPGLLQRFVSPLADELFSTLLTQLVSQPDKWDFDRPTKQIWFKALHSFLAASGDDQLSQQAQTILANLEAELQETVLDDDLVEENQSANITSLIEVLSLLDTQLQMNQTISASALTYFEQWLSHPGTQHLLKRCPACGSTVNFNETLGQWQIDDADFYTTPAIAAAYYMLQVQPQLAEATVVGFEFSQKMDASLKGLLQTMDQLNGKLSSMMQGGQGTDTSSVVSNWTMVSEPHAFVDAQTLIRILVIILSIELGWFLLRWRYQGQRH